MIQFLFQGPSFGVSHGPRTQALSAVTPNSRCGDINSTTPTRIAGLDTLAFWGHGDSYKLCDKNPTAMLDVISKWRKLNPDLKTIEIITCNARHSAGGIPYANKLKAKFGIMSGTRGLVVKALPVTVTGMDQAWSILLAETNVGSWCYVTAPGATDALLMEASSLIKFAKNANGGLVSFNGDIAERAGQMVKEHKIRKWTMNYGYFDSLRHHLVKV